MALFLFFFFGAGNRLFCANLLCLCQGDCVLWEECVKSQCVLAVLSSSLFTMAVTSLLASEARLRVIASEAVGVDDLMQEIRCIEPDVILLEETIPLKSQTIVIELLNSFSELKVIVLSENNNWLHIIRKDTLLISSTADLIQAIHPA
jgi:hypothetical protein